MAITKDYLNTSDWSVLAAWMQTNLVPNFFAEAVIENSTLNCKDADGNILMSKGSGTGVITAYKSTTDSASMSPGSSTAGQALGKLTYACKCTNGALLVFEQGAYIAHVIITKTNNNKTAIIFCQPNNATTTLTSLLNCVTWGDAMPNISYSFSAIPTNQTQLVSFCTDASYGSISFTPFAFYMPVGQYYNMGIGSITMNGHVYLTNGYWAILDS